MYLKSGTKVVLILKKVIIGDTGTGDKLKRDPHLHGDESAILDC